MKLKPAKLAGLRAERGKLLTRLGRIDQVLAAHERAVIAERREKRKRPSPPRAPITNPDVAIVRRYAKHVFGDVQVFNSRRLHDRRVKIWLGLSPETIEVHRGELLELLPHATISLALPPRCHSLEDDRRCICVNLPL